MGKPDLYLGLKKTSLGEIIFKLRPKKGRFVNWCPLPYSWAWDILCFKHPCGSLCPQGINWNACGRGWLKYKEGLSRHNHFYIQEFWEGGQGYSSLVNCLPHRHRDLGSIPSTNPPPHTHTQSLGRSYAEWTYEAIYSRHTHTHTCTHTLHLGHILKARSR